MAESVNRATSTICQALATGYGLIEGPVWDPDEGLYWSDVAHGGVHRLARSGAVTTVIRQFRYSSTPSA